MFIATPSFGNNYAAQEAIRRFLCGATLLESSEFYKH